MSRSCHPMPLPRTRGKRNSSISCCWPTATTTTTPTTTATTTTTVLSTHPTSSVITPPPDRPVLHDALLHLLLFLLFLLPLLSLRRALLVGIVATKFLKKPGREPTIVRPGGGGYQIGISPMLRDARGHSSAEGGYWALSVLLQALAVVKPVRAGGRVFCAQ